VGQLHISGREPATGRCITVTIEAGLIVSVEAAHQDCDLWISAGLIDLQVNGYRGLDLNGCDVSSETVSQRNRCHNLCTHRDHGARVRDSASAGLCRASMHF
jgi:N-acetylglucosamine-6-phosphate deacetylase